MIKPITPDEVIDNKAKEVIPDYVFEAFNFLISKNFFNGSSTFKQDEVSQRIVSEYNRHCDPSRSRISINEEYLFENKFLDVEDIYRDAGWEVYYDSPAYGETNDATFKFSKKSKK